MVVHEIYSERVLKPEEWQERRDAHRARIEAWIDPHLSRSRRGERHPVYDFLFTYYSYRPSLLKRWHPGPGLMLAGAAAAEYLQWPEYAATVQGVQGVRLERAALPVRRREFSAWLDELLRNMQARPAFFGCFGLHEWAMVYRQSAAEVRHSSYPLRLPPADIALAVEASGVCCTHYDAFRFFTAAAQPLNRHRPTRGTTPELEQRGCLHANMDLYKWAFKLAPFSGSELVADCFALARDIREVDMRASPYDLAALGFAAIPVETAEGRSIYEEKQRAFSVRGEPLRRRLREVCAWLLAG